jgi:hypothetical protein
MAEAILTSCQISRTVMRLECPPGRGKLSSTRLRYFFSCNFVDSGGMNKRAWCSRVDLREVQWEFAFLPEIRCRQR